MKLAEMRLFSLDYEVLYQLMKMGRELEKLEALELAPELKILVKELRGEISRFEFEVVSKLPAVT
jgi:hypothetical protein